MNRQFVALFSMMTGACALLVGCAIFQGNPDAAQYGGLASDVLTAAGTNAPAVLEAVEAVWVAAGPQAPAVLAALLNYEGKPGDQLAAEVLAAAGTNAPTVIDAALGVWSAAGTNAPAMMATAAGKPVTITQEQLAQAAAFLAQYGTFSLPDVAEPPPGTVPPPAPVIPGASGSISSPADVRGYGVVNGWMGWSESKRAAFATSLKASGCTATHIELMGWADTSAWGSEASIDKRLEQAREFIGSMRAKGIVTLVNVVNANVGSGKHGDDKKWPVSKIPDAWFRRIIDYLADKIGAEMVIVQPLSEHSGSKALSWANYAKARWPGRLCWNEGSRPTSHPAGYWAHEYHPATTSDVGKGAGCIVTTDHSSVLRDAPVLRQLGTWTGNTDYAALAAYRAKVQASGRGFLHYDFARRGDFDAKAVETCGGK